MDVSAEGFVVHKPAELLREEDAKFFAVVMGAIVFERLVVSLALLDIKPYAVIVAFAGDRRGIRFFFGRFFTGGDVRIKFGRNGRRKGLDVLDLFGFGVGVGGVGFVKIDHSEVVDVIDHDC